MERIVIGVDGSRAALTAIRWAGELVARTGAEALAVHAYRQPYSELSPDDLDKLLAERAEVVAGTWLPRAGELAAGFQTRVLQGDPRTVLLRAVTHEHADGLVVGRAGAGGSPGFLHVGSVAEHVAHHVDVPLVVIPSDAEPGVERIVLGVDGSDESAAAVRWCAPVAAATGAEVIAVTIEEPIVEWTPSWSDRNWRRAAEHDVERWVEPLTAAGVAAEAVVVEQLNVVDGLLGVATARQADLLVVGNRGAGGFSGLRMGGVALKTLHRATMPVVLVPPTNVE